MILQALNDYYLRKASDPENGIAPEGFGYVELPFLIHIDQSGKFLSIQDTRTQNGKRLVGQKFLVPAAVSRTVGVKANLLWDKADYALGIPDASKLADVEKKAKKDPQKYTDSVVTDELDSIKSKTKIRFESFISEIKEQKFSDTLSVQTLLKFLSDQPIEQIEKNLGTENNIWKAIVSENPNISFWIGNDENPICSMFQNEIKIGPESGAKPDEKICLITGEKSPIARIHPMIKNVKDAQSSGAAIVSFNKQSFESFGKKQSFNAPISESATFAYTTALNMLLAKDSSNKMRVGDATAIFWSEKKTHFESIFPAFWDYSKDNPDADVLAVKQLYESINTGASVPELKTKFYVLGLSPNAARLSVRFWHMGTIEEFSSRIKQHFDDLEIVRSPKDNGKYSLFWLLNSIALGAKNENVPPKLNGDVVKTILSGNPYPVTLLHQCIRRIRAEQSVTRMRAGILKAYLNRWNRFYKKQEKEITMSLDSTNENVGYRLGRLFATFEKLQEDAQPGINATIKDRFYGAASSTPCTVFPQLFKLKHHHLAKLSNVARKVWFEKIIGEIMDGISADGLPAHLSLEDQARFAIGYYHQRQDFFTSKKENINEKTGDQQ